MRRNIVLMLSRDYSLKLQGAIHQWGTRVLNKIEGLIFYPDLHLMLVSGSRLDLLVHRHQPGLGGWIPDKRALERPFSDDREPGEPKTDRQCPGRAGPGPQDVSFLLPSVWRLRLAAD